MQSSGQPDYVNSGATRPSSSAWPAPNALPVLVDLTHAVKGYAMHPLIGIDELKPIGRILGKAYLLKRYQDNLVLDPVVVTQLEVAARQTRVPANAVQQLVNGNYASSCHCLAEIRLIRLPIMFEQVFMLIHAAHLKIIRARQFGQARNLVPSVNILRPLHFDELFFPRESARRPVGLATGGVLHFNRNQF